MSAGDNVATAGEVEYVRTSCKLTGYSRSDFPAQLPAFKRGLVNYLGLTAGIDGVTFLDATDTRRRKLLNAATVRVKLLLTQSDSSSAIISALNTSSPTTADAMRASLNATMPNLSEVSVTEATVIVAAVDETYKPSKEEDEANTFGYYFLIALVVIFLMSPLVMFLLGLWYGPSSKLGRVVLVFIGEEKFATFQKMLCFQRTAQQARGPKVMHMIPRRREAPKFHLPFTNARPPPPPKRGFFGRQTTIIENAVAVKLENVRSLDDGARVTLRAMTNGTTYEIALHRDSDIAVDASVGAWDSGKGDVARDAVDALGLESLRRCSYEGEATDSSGKTLRAFGTVCHGRLRVVIQPHVGNDLLTITGDLLGERSEAVRAQTQGRMLGVEEIDVAAVTIGESWHLSDELAQFANNATDGFVISPDQPIAYVDDAGAVNASSGVHSRKLLQSSVAYVELVFWGAKDFMNVFDYDVNAFIEESLLQLKVVQNVYDQTSGMNPPLKFVVKQFLYTAQGSSDPWGVYASTDLGNMLSAAQAWSERRPDALSFSTWDSVIITTNRDLTFFGATGMATVGSICTLRSVSTNAVTKGQYVVGGNTIAHEFAHVLGIMHDGDAGAGTSSCSGNFIMSSAQSDAESLSPCSVEQYNSGTFRWGGLVYTVDKSCLTTTTETFCGNGIREKGEQCDCYGNDCAIVDPACHGSNCTLVSGAVCSVLHDKCCNINGTAAAASGTVCRAATDASFNIPCDVEEVCDGSSFACPADSAAPNGKKCEDAQGDVGACFDGVCENRDKGCKVKGYYGGKWCSAACASSVSGYTAAPFHIFDEYTCRESLWCAAGRDSCDAGLYLWNDVMSRRDGFPCSNANLAGTFPKVCYNGAYQGASAVASASVTTTAVAAAAAGGSRAVIASADSEVEYVRTSCKLTGYSRSDFPAQLPAFKRGLVNYLGLTAGIDGVTFLDATDTRRRKLLNAATVRVKLLLTQSDSSSAIISALNTSSPTTADAMRASLNATMPNLSEVSVTEATVIVAAVDETYKPSKEEDEANTFGYYFLIALVVIFLMSPLVMFLLGLWYGPSSKLGRVVLVFIGEEKFATFQKMLCFQRTAQQARGPKVMHMIPRRREAPKFHLPFTNARPPPPPKRGFFGRQT
ncbi:hypothetical protein BE221DRAFT_143585 [Ostreococcus tauri]|uniref:Uncharacterized protein n=1 Tax=Ostreococcus tauri TaxID=70448 RepID=A0A1Y5IJ98_OSTTA|nr:hypothetical protein BE221DRAFT_143585 [Ostreococcus tauri]